MTNPRADEPGPAADDAAIATAAVLNEPVRRALFEHIASHDDSVDRDEAAAATGIGRPLAAFHLDRLVAAGLLEVEYRRRNGRTGPGAGRPAKFYRRTRGLQVELSLPARRYRLAAEILADGLDRRPDAAARDAVRAAARDRGAALGAAPRAGETADPLHQRRSTGRDRLRTVLREEGFDPADDGDEIRLRNCPFDAIATDHRDLTCPMNLALLEGIVDGVGDRALRAVASPVDGSCCVRLVPVPG